MIFRKPGSFNMSMTGRFGSQLPVQALAERPVTGMLFDLFIQRDGLIELRPVGGCGGRIRGGSTGSPT